ncbi:MAG: hypothetical protein C4617_03450 [Candidatus Liberibacter europaeus]|uniref:Multidrug transporter n=1 Tax=Candidatus Liberibacter europaeus TaxID=744859 RepID=A0A2T4VXG2_9HYPH|nr:hypothetical protein [Candidatus Liberibacter europaeus]PTL86467.1 MAG: hypothetical protein C4617_03450 [Candidatus Liberibacter europaeus]
MKWIFLYLNITISVMSFVFVKISVTRQEVVFNLLNTIHIPHNIFYWLGFICYSSTFFVYAFLIAQFPLQIAQTIVTCSIIVIITLISSLFWQEPFYWTTTVGIGLITAGMTLLSFN